MTEETKQALDYLVFTIEDIFDIDALLKKSTAKGVNSFEYIKKGVSEELDYKRHQLSALDDLLEEVNQSIDEKLTFKPKKVFKHFSTYRTMLIPQFGYHVSTQFIWGQPMKKSLYIDSTIMFLNIL